MFISTTDLPHQKYTVIGPVFDYANSGTGMKKLSSPMQTYDVVVKQLEAKAAAMGADAIIGATFDFRVVAEKGMAHKKNLFEVIAYGTAVKLD